MEIVLDFSPVYEYFSQDPSKTLLDFMVNFGWIILGIMFLFAFRTLWLSRIRGRWFSNIEFVLLAIDIPRGNVQSPRAVENMFSYLAGAHGGQNFFEKWFLGEFQLSLSLEIVSLEGYTQFLIRTPVQFRSLVESAVYSQYPDAEVVEVDDYCDEFPRKFPDEEYDVWGTEFIPANHYMYPIKTYESFEHKLGPEEITFKDPMAELMELCSSLRKGENFWYQIILIPEGFDWIDDLGPQIDEILGKKPKVSFLNSVIDFFINIISDLSEAVVSIWGDVEDEEKEFKKLSMVELTPRQKKRIEALEGKASKMGFACKIRVVYMSKKEVMNKAKVVNGFVGFLKQFADLDLNNLKPDMKKTATKAAYFNKKEELIRRKNNIVNNYMNRDDWAGRTPFILNIEELATLWHFPIEATANAPLIQKTPAKRHKPPANLMSEDQEMGRGDAKNDLLFGDFSKKDKLEDTKVDTERDFKPEIEQEEAKGQAPSNLPF